MTLNQDKSTENKSKISMKIYMHHIPDGYFEYHLHVFFSSLCSLYKFNYYFSISQQFGTDYTPKSTDAQWKFQIGKLKKYEDH